jgi:hypothetical protein
MNATDKLPTSKRAPVLNAECAAAVGVLAGTLMERLREKGHGKIASRQEALGMITEEYHELELIEAVRSGNMGDVRGELLDVAVDCVFTVACIDAGKMEW